MSRAPHTVGTGLSRAWRGLSTVLFASFGFVAIRFLLTPLRIKILTAMLNKEQYGTLTLVSVAVALATMVFSMGSLEFLIRKVPGRDESFQYDAYKTVMLAFGGLFALLSFAAAVLLGALRPASVLLDAPDYWICALLLLLTVHVCQRVYFLMGQRKYVQARITQLIYADTYFLPLLVFLWRGDLSLRQVLWIWVAWLVVAMLLSARWVEFGKVWRARFRVERLREVLAFGLPLLLMTLGDMLFQSMDRFLLVRLRDAGAVANYALCMNIAMVVFIAGVSLIEILSTEFFRVRNELPGRDLDALVRHPELRARFTSMVRDALVISIPGAAGLCLLGREILVVLSNPGYLDAAVLFPWAAPVPFLFLLFYIFGRTLIALDRNLQLGCCSVGGALLQAVLCLLLVPPLGERGAALATALSLIVLNLVLALSIRAHRWIDWREIRFIRLLTLAVMCGLGLAAVQRWVSPHSALAALGAAGALCGGALLLLGLVRKEDFGLTPSPVPREP